MPPSSGVPTEQQDATVLTPTVRLARTLGAQYAATQHAAGHALWQPPQILSWRAWTTSLWQGALLSGIEERTLLTPLQERTLWENILRTSGEQTQRSIASLAAVCADATALLGAHDPTASATHRFLAHPHSQGAFSKWWNTFEEHCTASHFLPAGFLDAALATHIRSGQLPLASSYQLHGFLDLTPSQADLVEALRSAGALVSHIELTGSTGVPPALTACASPQEELTECTAWARHALEARTQRIAIVVPDLHACRPQLERTLRTALAPHCADVTSTGLRQPYEFSTGKRLATLPMIADALILLRWCSNEISLDEVAALLRSRFLSLAQSPEQGAEIEAKHFRYLVALRGVISMGRFAFLISQNEPTVAGILRDLLSATSRLTGERTYGHFADETRALLQQAAWPGQALDSDEFQASERWNDLLDDLASLDLFGSRTTFASFLQQLIANAHNTVFAPENTGAPVQITTVSEAFGQQADTLWFLHADEANWPPQQQPHPLLPIALQQALGLPGTDPAHDEATARRQLDFLLRTSANATFSYATISAEAVQRPSPAILALSNLVVSAPAQQALPTTSVSPLLQIQDVSLPPPLPQGASIGGVDILQAQAACGFRAFAEKRLYSRKPESKSAGWQPNERGDQVHDVLQLFWREVETHANLRAHQQTTISTGFTECDRILQACINSVVALPENASAWETRYRSLQRQRLHRLLAAWLDFEATRPPFRVQDTEKELESVVIGPLTLKVRLDRIDRIEDGEEGTTRYLIDYKTGSAVHLKSEWMGDRPDEPQLPLYAVAGGIPAVEGIAFGAVKVGQKGMKLEAMADDPGVIGAKNRIDMSFESAMEAWRSTLTELATDFAEGHTDVFPKDYPKTCDRCDQRILCRLNPDDLYLDDPTDDDEDNAW